MKFGLHVPLFGDFAEPALVVEVAREAELAGWDGFFVWDHIAPPWNAFNADAWITLAAVAVATDRIRFGTLMTPLARRRPWKVARETATLDRLSRGRLVLGIGLGGTAAEGFASEFDNLGEEPNLAVRANMVDEALEVITGLWSGETLNYHGRFYTVSEERFLPRPVQEPRIPIWVAATWPHRGPLLRATHWDGVFPTLGTEDRAESLRRLADMVAYIRRRRSATTPFDIVCGGETSGSDRAQDSATVTSYADAGATWWLENITPTRWGSWEHWPTAAMRQRILQGPPTLAS